MRRKMISIYRLKGILESDIQWLEARDLIADDEARSLDTESVRNYDTGYHNALRFVLNIIEREGAQNEKSESRDL